MHSTISAKKIHIGIVRHNTGNHEQIGEVGLLINHYKYSKWAQI